MKTKQLQSLIILNGLAVTLTPTNIQIIGDLAADEPLGGDAQARMITRFAQRSMMYLPRNDSSVSKRQLFLEAEYQFTGLGSDSKKWFSPETLSHDPFQRY